MDTLFDKIGITARQVLGQFSSHGSDKIFGRVFFWDIWPELSYWTYKFGPNVVRLISFLFVFFFSF